MSTVPFNRARPLSPEITKTLPWSKDAEAAVLGAVVLDNEALKIAAANVGVEDFFLKENQRIFLSMLALAEVGKPIESLTLIDKLQSEGALDSAGGYAYIASLGDGMPKVSNVAHYAQIVKEKSRLRQIIHLTNKIQLDAIEGFSKPDELATQLENFGKQTLTTKDNPAVVVGFRSLLTLQMPPVEFVIEPLLTVGGTGMLFAWRGVGKSFVMTEMATQIALGAPKVWPWPISRAYRVLYIYGEMHGSTIKDRAIQLAKGHSLLAQDDLLTKLETNFGLMSKDFQMLEGQPRNAKTWRPKISSARDRKIIEERIFGGGYEVVILDNISTLWPASQEGESDMVSELQEWFVDLNQRRVTIIFLHHAGKGGEQRGWSGKEDILDFTLKLRTPGDYKQEQQLRAEVTIEKKRHEAKELAFLAPFEISLSTDTADGAQWLMRPMKDLQKKTAFEDFAQEMKPREVSQELGIPLRTVYRWYNNWKKDHDVKSWIDSE
jgi:DnaB helicase-like protein/AAA domain-containing protein/Homeodomain-like domain-containing protein